MRRPPPALPPPPPPPLPPARPSPAGAAARRGAGGTQRPRSFFLLLLLHLLLFLLFLLGRGAEPLPSEPPGAAAGPAVLPGGHRLPPAAAPRRPGGRRPRRQPAQGKTEPWEQPLCAPRSCGVGILEIFAVSQGIVGIRGVFSNKFLAMSKKGKLHASAHFTSECQFRERFQENSYNTYASAVHRGRRSGRECPPRRSWPSPSPGPRRSRHHLLRHHHRRKRQRPPHRGTATALSNTASSFASGSRTKRRLRGIFGEERSPVPLPIPRWDGCGGTGGAEWVLLPWMGSEAQALLCCC
uniref:Fibroblast growth factor n=1 Tax=Anas zonorhyncha TaxID=75864 RepID=A0A8B9ZMV1_9AVES